MSCNVNGKGCRVCPGMWVAAVLLLFAMIQSFFPQTPAEPLSAEARSAIDQPMDSN